MTVLRVENLCKSYEKFSLENVSFEVEKGAVMGFIGINGAGKSTTIKAMLDMIHYDSGKITIPEKKDLGVVIGDSDFYPNKKAVKVKNIVKSFYPDSWDEEKYGRYTKLFNVDDSKKISEFSSGMKIKFMIALALSHDAKLLIFDEPTSGLDPVSRDELCGIFKNLVKNGERSIFFSTHITSDLEKCATHITYIRNGRIFDSLPYGEMLEKYSYMGNGEKDVTIEDIIVGTEGRNLDAESFD